MAFFPDNYILPPPHIPDTPYTAPAETIETRIQQRRGITHLLSKIFLMHLTEDDAKHKVKVLCALEYTSENLAHIKDCLFTIYQRGTLLHKSYTIKL